MMKSIFLAGTLAATQTLAFEVPFTPVPPVIDGQQESTWDIATWRPMPYLMAGSLPTSEDFSGRYRLLWDSQYLYLQAEISDDRLLDQTANPLEKYWDDDALEIFIDSDASGGIHQFNHSALAYHIALDNQVVDIGDDHQAHLYNEHLDSRWRRQVENENRILWEVAIKLYPNDYSDAVPKASIKLNPDDKIGFMLAYCDNDASPEREHFMGSHEVKALKGDKNRGYIDADVFGEITLAK